MNLIMSLLFKGFEEQIKNWLIDTMKWMFGLVNSFTDPFWENGIVNSVFAFVTFVANIILVASLVFVLLDIAEESGAGNRIGWTVVVSNFFKGFIFANGIVLIGRYMCTVSSQLVGMLPMGQYTAGDGYDWVDVLDVVNGSLSVANTFIPYLIMVIVLTIGAAAFLLMSMLRFTNMFIHVIGGLYYISDIVRGETSALGSWLRQAIVIACTYIIQYIMFSIGVTLIVDRDLTGSGAILGLGFIIGMFSVPKILQKYGMSSGVSGVVGALGSVVNRGMALVH